MINNETLIADKKYFITNTSNPSIFDWMLSKGTNYTCYVEVMSKLSDDDIYNRRIDKVRILVTTIQTPLQFYFFYWSLLVFVLHKFNFKKPVMKIILGHLLIRCTGNILEQFGEFYKYYYVSEKDGDVYKCKYENNVHPFRWFLTRQIGTIFWYVGEIIADWYPLLRTKAVVKNKSLIYIYITCAIFNLSKIALIILHLLKSPSKLYNIDDGTYNDKDMNFFYLVYWTIQLTIIYTSVLYEFSVYIVLKNNIFKVTQYDFGFLKKFKTLSEYRILVSAFVSLIFLPVISVTFILKFIFYYYKHNLNFDFEVVRQAIANVQYYMIFIDQILLFYSSYESKLAAFEFYSDRGNNKSNGDILNTSFNFNSNNEKKSKFKQRRNTINIISSSNNKLSSTSDYNNHNNHNNNINNINNINNFNNNIHTKHYSFENSVEADTSMSYIDNNINNINNTDNINNNNNNNNNINNNNNNNTNNNYNNNYNNKDHHYHRTRNSVMFIEN